MTDFDLAKFWADDALAHEDNCFAKGPQVALGIRMHDECVFSELGEEGTPWKPIAHDRRIELNKRYNDKAEKIVGLRLLQEEYPPEDAAFPVVKRIGEVFGGRYEYQHDSEWLMQSVDDADGLPALLDRVEAMDLRAFMLPDNWETEKKRIYETYGLLPPRMHHVRGPVTLACSIMGSENLIFTILDEPDLARRFSDAIANVAIGMARVMDEEAGRTGRETAGFSFADDNCCLLNVEMYELFGYPVLKKVFDTFSPEPGDMRYQHSDSAMGHLLPVLGRLNLTGVNFGPTVLTPEIRAHLPKARIDGCIAPLAFMRNDVEAITSDTIRDCKDGLRYGGVNLSTAGSISDGSRLSSMRLIMELIAEHGRR